MKEGAGAVGEGCWLWVFHALRCAEAIRRELQSGVEVLCSHAQRMAKRKRDPALDRWKAPFSGLRRISSEHAAKHTGKAVLLWQLRGVKQVYLVSFSEEELCDREPFDEMHESRTARALP